MGFDLDFAALGGCQVVMHCPEERRTWRRRAAGSLGQEFKKDNYRTFDNIREGFSLDRQQPLGDRSACRPASGR